MLGLDPRQGAALIAPALRVLVEKEFIRRRETGYKVVHYYTDELCRMPQDVEIVRKGRLSKHKAVFKRKQIHQVRNGVAGVVTIIDTGEPLDAKGQLTVGTYDPHILLQEADNLSKLPARANGQKG